MTDQPPSQQPSNEQGGATPAPLPQPSEATGGQTAQGPVPVPPAGAVSPVPPSPPYAADGPGGVVAGSSGSPFPADRPEIAVGAAFAGGLVLALILKRLAR